MKYIEDLYIKMGTGELQLIQRGGEDIYLTGNPSISHFQQVYHRHSPFGMEYISLYFIF